jgi:hypothetical protein
MSRALGFDRNDLLANANCWPSVMFDTVGDGRAA